MAKGISNFSHFLGSFGQVPLKDSKWSIQQIEPCCIHRTSLPVHYILKLQILLHYFLHSQSIVEQVAKPILTYLLIYQRVAFSFEQKISKLNASRSMLNKIVSCWVTWQRRCMQQMRANQRIQLLKSSPAFCAFYFPEIYPIMLHTISQGLLFISLIVTRQTALAAMYC